LGILYFFELNWTTDTHLNLRKPKSFGLIPLISEGFLEKFIEVNFVKNFLKELFS